MAERQEGKIKISFVLILRSIQIIILQLISSFVALFIMLFTVWTEELRSYGHHASQSYGRFVLLVYQIFATILLHFKFLMLQQKYLETFIEKYFLKVVMEENFKFNSQKKKL